MSQSSKLNAVGILCWGPVESLNNGHFVRVYALLELISKYLRKSPIVIEYTEDITPKQYYNIKMLNEVNTIKISVPGNEKQQTNTLIKYIRFFIYQFINTLILRRILKRISIMIVGGELFTSSTILFRLLNKNAIIVADPQMILSEREYRAKRRGLLTHIFNLMEKIYFKKSHFVIAISIEMKAKIANNFHVPDERIVVIPHILPKRLSKTYICKGQRLIPRSDSVVRLTFVGSLIIHHNLEAVVFLVKVLPIVMKLSRRSMELLVVGPVNVDVLKFLENLLKTYNVVDNVRVLGLVEDLDEVLCSSHILLAPMFTMSGVSTKMLYYLRFKEKTILASKEAVEGIDVLVKRHGKVIVAGDPKDFVLKLVKLVSKNDR